ncbi:LysR family transcriptional regulator [Saccharomonospora sp. NPDC006951]
MELREIEVFLALADELHFGRAAQRLHVSQGRVSQTIRALETEIGGALFDRAHRGVSLTPLGVRFREGARRGYDELTATLRDCRTAARDVTGQLRISYLPSIGNELATRVVSAFEARHPGCTVILNTLQLRYTLDPEPLLVEGGTDVALCWSPGGDGRALRSSSVVIGPVLAEVPRAVLMPSDHPLATRSSVTLDDLADYELINPANASSLHRDLWTPRVSGTGRRLKLTTSDIVGLTHRPELTADDVLTLVARGHGLHCTVATLLDHIPFPGLALIPITDMPPMVLVPVWAAASENATIRAFAEIAEETVKPRRKTRSH